MGSRIDALLYLKNNITRKVVNTLVAITALYMAPIILLSKTNSLAAIGLVIALMSYVLVSAAYWLCPIHKRIWYSLGVVIILLFLALHLDDKKHTEDECVKGAPECVDKK